MICGYTAGYKQSIIIVKTHSYVTTVYNNYYDVLQIMLRCLPPNWYTIKLVGKYQGAEGLKKGI